MNIGWVPGTKGISWPEKEVAMLVLRISPETLATIAEQEEELELEYCLQVADPTMPQCEATSGAVLLARGLEAPGPGHHMERQAICCANQLALDCRLPTNPCRS